MELERRVTRLEDASNGIGPLIRDISVNLAKVNAQMSHMITDMETVKDLSQQAVSAQIAYARDTATQEERWKGHADDHARLEDVSRVRNAHVDKLFFNQGKRLDKVESYVTTNRVNIGKILALGGGGGLLGGTLLTVIIEAVKAFL